VYLLCMLIITCVCACVPLINATALSFGGRANMHALRSKIIKGAQQAETRRDSRLRSFSGRVLIAGCNYDRIYFAVAPFASRMHFQRQFSAKCQMAGGM